ncbi:MAG: AsmA family protein [Candidatus Glassbacteria bacterium]|nr:AsmA family protein [Candidatus Glassbacteria bacterium]
MGSRTVKVIAWAAGALLLLCLVPTVAVWLLLPVEKIRTIAEQRITEETGRQCTIEDLGLSLWRGMTLDLEGVELAAGEGEEIPHTARLEHLYLKMKLLPLLSRRVEVVSLTLSGPEIFVVRDRGGALNLAEIIPKEQETEEPPGDEAFSLLLLRVLVEDCVLHYHDYMDSVQVTVAGIEGELNMLPADGGSSFPLHGRLEIGELRGREPELREQFEGALPAVARFEGSAAVDWSWIELTRVTFTAAGVRLDGPLRLDFSKPDSLSWSTKLRGGADDPALLSELLLPQDFPRRIGELSVELDADGHQLNIRRLEIGMGDDMLALSGTVNLAEPYAASAALKADISLEGLEEFLEGEQRWEAAGKLSVDLTLAAKLQNPLESWSASGTVSAGAVEIILPGERPALRISRLRATLSRRDLASGSLALEAGGSELRAELSVINWPGLLPPENPLASGRARWKLTANANRLNLPELLGPEYVSSSENVSRTAVDSARTPIALGDGRGSLTAVSLAVLDGVGLENSGLWFTVRDSLLRIDSVRSGYSGGRLSGGGAFVLSTAGVESWSLDLRVDEVQAGQMLQPFSSVGKFLTGSLKSSISLRSGNALALDPSSGLSGSATFTLSDGRFEGWPALNAIASLTGIDELRDLEIDDWVGTMEIRDGRVFGDNLQLNTTAGLIGAEGSLGLDGSLDYNLTLALNQRLSEKCRELLRGELANLLTGGQGTVELALELKGTTTEPKISWDTRPMAERAAKNIKRSVRKLFRKLLK